MGSGVSTPPPQLRSSAVFYISLHFRILKMIITSGFHTTLKCTKFDFGRGSAPDLAGGAYRPLSGLKAEYSDFRSFKIKCIIK